MGRFQLELIYLYYKGKLILVNVTILMDNFDVHVGYIVAYL